MGSPLLLTKPETTGSFWAPPATSRLWLWLPSGVSSSSLSSSRGRESESYFFLLLSGPPGKP